MTEQLSLAFIQQVFGALWGWYWEYQNKWDTFSWKDAERLENKEFIHSPHFYWAPTMGQICFWPLVLLQWTHADQVCVCVCVCTRVCTIMPVLRVFTFWQRELWGFPCGTSGKEPACQCRKYKMRVWSLGWGDPLEEGMTVYSSILAWRIPWTEELGVLQSIGLQRVRHNWSNLALTHYRGR